MQDIDSPGGDKVATFTPSGPDIPLETTTTATGMSPTPPPTVRLSWLASKPVRPILVHKPMPIFMMGMMTLSSNSIGSEINWAERASNSSSRVAFMASYPLC